MGVAAKAARQLSYKLGFLQSLYVMIGFCGSICILGTTMASSGQCTAMVTIEVNVDGTVGCNLMHQFTR